MAASKKCFAILHTHFRACTHRRRIPGFREPRQALSRRTATFSSSPVGHTLHVQMFRTQVAFMSIVPTAESRGSNSLAERARLREFDGRLGTSREITRQASTQATSASSAREEPKTEDDQKRESKVGAEEAAAAEEKEEVDEKTQTLRAALAHVPKFGWTETAIVAGAKDVGLSPSIAGAFPRKEAALVEFFMDECTQALIEELESREDELGKLVLQDRIAKIVWMRLEMQIPYLPKWAQALSVQANPVNLPSTIKQRAVLTDEIWHSAGDRSADVDWYAKRAMLTAVYSTAELYMLTDTSPGFRDTQAFLERRINDILDCRKTVQEAGHLAQAVQAGLQNTVNSFLNSSSPSSGVGV